MNFRTVRHRGQSLSWADIKAHERVVVLLTLLGTQRPGQPKAIATMPELGDGALYRTIVRVQKVFYDPPDLRCNESRPRR